LSTTGQVHGNGMAHIAHDIGEFKRFDFSICNFSLIPSTLSHLEYTRSIYSPLSYSRSLDYTNTPTNITPFSFVRFRSLSPCFTLFHHLLFSFIMLHSPSNHPEPSSTATHPGPQQAAGEGPHPHSPSLLVSCFGLDPATNNHSPLPFSNLCV
jgi:hypothetical protein